MTATMVALADKIAPQASGEDLSRMPEITGEEVLRRQKLMMEEEDRIWQKFAEDISAPIIEAMLDLARKQMIDIEIKASCTGTELPYAKFQIPLEDWSKFTAVLENFRDDPDWHKW